MQRFSKIKIDVIDKAICDLKNMPLSTDWLRRYFPKYHHFEIIHEKVTPTFYSRKICFRVGESTIIKAAIALELNKMSEKARYLLVQKKMPFGKITRDYFELGLNKRKLSRMQNADTQTVLSSLCEKNQRFGFCVEQFFIDGIKAELLK